MRQFTGLESSFLTLETKTDHLHIGTLLVLDREDREDAASVDRIRQLIDSRIHQVRSLRRRMVEVPLGLDHPVWIEDPDFDLEAHLHHIAVPHPGDDEQLSNLVGHLLGIPLHRDRPLWELYVIEGLKNNRVAVLAKMHAAAIDRDTGAEILVSLLDFQPEPKQSSVLQHPWIPDREPNSLELLVRTAGNWLRNPLRAIDVVPQVVGSALNLRRALAERGRVQPGIPGRAPSTPFNGALTPHRAMAWHSLQLEDVKKVKNTFGTKLNDVVLTVIAGALRAYLDERGALPTDPLMAMVPLSLIDADMSHQEGVAPLFVPLSTEIADPVRRLRRLSETFRLSPMAQKAVSADLLQDVTRFAPPVVAARAARMYSRYRVADRHSPLFNVVVTNVPGPPFTLYFAGARVVHNYTASPIFNAAGLSLTIQSHGDTLDVAILACPELVSDSWRLSELLGDSMKELLDAASAVESSVENSKNKSVA